MPRPARILAGLVLVAGLVLSVVGVGTLGLHYRLYVVSGASMQPTLRTGDRMVGRTGPSAVAPGDIVVLAPGAWTGPRAPDADQVKRVLAVGGDTVVCCDSTGRATLGTRTGAAGATLVPVPAGRLFVVGDNPEVSVDSRAHLEISGGTVETGKVLARVEAVAYPFADRRVFGGGGPVHPLMAALAGVVLLGIGAVSGSLMDQRRPAVSLRRTPRG